MDAVLKSGSLPVALNYFNRFNRFNDLLPMEPTKPAFSEDSKSRPN
jgi:hypothetical protein